MDRSPMKLHKAARMCRDIAAECVTDGARDALLEAADSLDGEATAKERLPGERSAFFANP